MIQVNNLSFHYQGVKRNVFSDFNMTLKENNIYGLLGKNGTGKSTLLYLISGLLRQQQGTILIDGISSCDRRPDVLRDIFIVTEEFFLPNVSLDVYVKMNRPFYPNFSQEVLDRCLQDFELPLSLNLNELSMGQKKKAYMSFALATGTKYLFMDEPTNGLDIPSKSQFRKVIANNMTDERMLIISTHQVHDIESLLDHIVILNQNNLLLDASVADICEDYSFEYRTPADMDDTVLYAEPTLQGNDDSRLGLLVDACALCFGFSAGSTNHSAGQGSGQGAVGNARPLLLAQFDALGANHVRCAMGVRTHGRFDVECVALSVHGSWRVGSLFGAAVRKAPYGATRHCVVCLFAYNVGIVHVACQFFRRCQRGLWLARFWRRGGVVASPYGLGRIGATLSAWHGAEYLYSDMAYGLFPGLFVQCLWCVR